jgi:hypothetical protein
MPSRGCSTRGCWAFSMGASAASVGIRGESVLWTSLSTLSVCREYWEY